MMFSSARRALRAVLGGCLVLFSNEARAEGPASRLHIRYEVVSGCPSRSDFLEALESRIQASWIDGSDTRSFDVRVTRAPGGGFTGRLEIHQPNRPPSTREIHDDSCKAVARSLAVFVAIAVDPASAAAPPEQPAPPAPHPEPPDTTDELEPPSPRPPVAPTRRSTVMGPAAPEPPTPWTWSAGYAVNHLQASRPAWGGRVHAELARGDERERVVPALRLSFGWADFSTFPPLAGEARFRLKSVRAEGCARYGLSPFAASACAGLDVGALTASAPELPRFAQVTTAWMAPAATLRGAWAIAPWLAVEVSAGVLFPVRRPRFTIQDPLRLVYRAPVVVFEGTVGLAAVARFD